MVLALVMPYLSDDFQAQVAVALQGTALAPFIALQERITEGRARADRIEYLQAALDSLTAVTSTQSAVIDENRELRDLLGLAQRAGPRFLPATVLRPGTPGSESMFIVNVGARDGVEEGAPVVSARGLMGRIREVRENNAVGMDWTHPDFRASAMLVGEATYGLVENVRGDFREEDRLMLNGTAYHERAEQGTLVVTSGLAGLLPRGIPIGRIDATAEVQGSWRKSYWLRPLVDPSSVTHVLVEARGTATEDLGELWAADSTAILSQPGDGNPAGVAPVSPGAVSPGAVGPGAVGPGAVGPG
jgi:rod shape-determining protein MreC